MRHKQKIIIRRLIGNKNRGASRRRLKICISHYFTKVIFLLSLSIIFREEIVSRRGGVERGERQKRADDDKISNARIRMKSREMGGRG